MTCFHSFAALLLSLFFVFCSTSLLTDDTGNLVASYDYEEPRAVGSIEKKVIQYFDNSSKAYPFSCHCQRPFVSVRSSVLQ